MKKNYAGYNDKVTVSNRNKFEVFTDSLLMEAGEAPPYQCFPILKKWLSFFKDKHMSISYDDSKFTKEQLINYYAKEEKTDWTDSLFNSYLKKEQADIDSLEGIWKDQAGYYQIGIVKDKNRKNEFIGFIIKANGSTWGPQQVKLRITKNRGQYRLKVFRAIDHSENQLFLQKVKDTLTFGDGTVTSKWYKNFVPPPKVSSQTANNELFPKFKFLDDKTCLFQMPSYASLDNVKVMDSLLKKNALELEKCEHLIIDLRNNYGGSVLSYDKLIPYLYANPILTEGGSVLATEENIRDYYSQIPSNIADSMKTIFEKNVRELKTHLNEIYPLYPVDTITFSKVFKNPKSVSLIINKNTASAAEIFVLQARQSTKVKLYGSNTSGAIDYLEVVRTKLPFGFYGLGYPACKSLRLPEYPLDNIGIKPDVEIPVTVSDWIDFVRTYTKK
ncbi:S41 family peptidase [Pedobacter rhodius]|uniref:S41 family peptidase n=1 Tax=Pedobacter rhodius TaxID=3004098 RepID=A0ABT4KUJ4_9SPHI|nr:S41 family peptidase [Pedobacter sp. SJ11]MCZ4222592.1 S41 family peptidase [Pedobacter sp. SJ11]